MEMDKLYKKDENGNIRVWWMEIDGNSYRTHSGIIDGKIVTSGWKYADAKNVGKANATTAEEQAILEVKSQYTIKQNQGKYHITIEDAQRDKKSFFSPMLASKYEDRKSKLSFPNFSQPKLDGVRCVAKNNGLFSRNGKRLVSSPHIEKALDSVFEKHPNLVLDGELYCHDLRDNFDRIISLARKTKPTDLDLEEAKQIEYHVYDMFLEDEEHLSFDERSSSLYHLTKDLSDKIKFVETVPILDQESLDRVYAYYLSDGYEGQMIRISNSKYENKRSKNLIKRKEFQDEEFEIVSITEGVGNWTGMAKSITIKLSTDVYQESGLRGSFESNSRILEDKDEYIGGTATVRYQNKTPDGKLRFPVAVALYKGKRDL